MTRFAPLGILAAGVLVAACASMGALPGGPQDTSPPVVVSISPESGAVGASGRSIEIHFDETLEPPNDATGNSLVLLSPMHGAPRLTWRFSSLRITPRGGLRPNTAYTVTLLPGLRDRSGNATTEPRTFVFTTGREMPRFSVLGRVFDWAAARPAPNAIVTAVPRADTTLTYITTADSVGGFTLGPLPAGNYTVYGFVDQNRNRARDRTEAWDSAAVSLVSSRPIVELLTIQRDTLPPRVTTVAAEDSVRLRLTFDRALDPRQAITAAQVSVTRGDTALRVVSVQTEAQRQRAQDSARARADTSRRDTTARAGQGRAVAQDLPRPSVPSPFLTLFVELDAATPLRTRVPHKVVTRGIRSVQGVAAAEAERNFTPSLARTDSSAATGAPGTAPTRPPAAPTARP